MRNGKVLLATLLVVTALLASGCDQAAIDSLYGSEAPASEATAALTPSSSPSASPTPETTETPSPTPSPTEEPTPSPTPEPTPEVDDAFRTDTMQAVISDISFHQPPEADAPDIFHVRKAGSEEAQALQVDLVVSQETLIVDAQTGEKLRADSLEAGQEVAVWYSTAQPQAEAQGTECLAIMTNLAPEAEGQPAYVRASSVFTRPDGTLSVLNQNGDLTIVIPAALGIQAFGDPETLVEHAQILDGTQLLAWYEPALQESEGETTGTSVQATRIIAVAEAPARQADPTESVPAEPTATETTMPAQNQPDMAATPADAAGQPAEPAPENPQPVEQAPVPVT